MLWIEVNREKCNGCANCAKACPKGPRIWRMEKNSDQEKAVVVDASFCLLCGMCVTTCPTGAITITVGHDNYVSVLGAAGDSKGLK